MKLNPLLPILLVVAFSGSAQRIEINKGPVTDGHNVPIAAPSKYNSFSSTLFFNTQSKKTFTGYGLEDNDFNFTVLDDYVNYNGVKKLTAEFLNEKVHINAFISINNKMYVFYTIEYPEQDEFSIYVNEVDADMVILGSPIIVHNYKNRKQYDMNIAFTASKSKRYMLISRINDAGSEEKQKVECKLINDSFSEVWHEVFEIENTAKHKMQQVDVDNAGNLYMLAWRSPKRERPVLYTYFQKEKSFKSFDLGLTEGENFGAKLDLLNGEKPYVVGLNVSKKQVSYFIDRVDTKAKTIDHLGSSPMPSDFYLAARSGAFGMKDWAVTRMVSLANNNVVASIEATLVVLRDGRPFGYLTLNTYVVSFREDGSQAWTHTIHKRQNTMLEMAGHTLVPAQNNVLVIYNDHPENLQRKPEDKKATAFIGFGVTITVQEIDPAGKVIKYPFSKDPELQNHAINLSYTSKIEENLYYATTIRRSETDSRTLTFRVK